MVDDPTDRTLSLLTRSFVHKARVQLNHEHASVLLTSISAICYSPAGPRRDQVPSHMIKAMLTGVPYRSGQVLLRSIIHSFPHFDADAKLMTIVFLSSTVAMAELQQRSDAKLIKAISRSDGLLRTLFGSVAHSTLDVNPRQDVLGIMNFFHCFLDKVQYSDTLYLRNFFKACRQADLFDFLYHILRPGLVADYTYGERNVFAFLFDM